MSSVSAPFELDEAMAALENMLSETQRNPSSSSHRQALQRYLLEFEAPPGVARQIDRAMTAAAPAAEELRLLLVAAEKEFRTDTDQSARIQAAIAGFRRALLPVGQAIQAATPLAGEALREQVVTLEAACQRALLGDEDPLVRDALMRALVVFRPLPPPDAPLVVVGTANVANVRAQMVWEAMCRDENDRVSRELSRLCEALADLRETIDNQA